MDAAQLKNDPRMKLMKMQTAILAAILVILLIAGIFVAAEFSTIHRSISTLQTEVESLEMDSVNDAVAALTEAAENLAAVDVSTLNETAVSLREAADTLALIDTDTLNSTAASLKEAANNLSKVDTDSLNSLV